MENEEEKVIQSRPPAYASDKVLLDAFAGEVVKQSERFDELNLALLKFELGIPGLFVTALKLFPEDPIQTASKVFLVAALVFWMIALGITLCGIKPKKYEQVLRDVVHSSSPGPTLPENSPLKNSTSRQLNPKPGTSSGVLSPFSWEF